MFLPNQQTRRYLGLFVAISLCFQRKLTYSLKSLEARLRGGQLYTVYGFCFLCTFVARQKSWLDADKDSVGCNVSLYIFHPSSLARQVGLMQTRIIQLFFTP